MSKKPESAFKWWIRECEEDTTHSTGITSKQKIDTNLWDALPDKSRWYRLAALDKQRYDAELGIQRMLVGVEPSTSGPEVKREEAKLDDHGFHRQEAWTVVGKTLSPYAATMRFFYDIFPLLKRVEVEQCRRVCCRFNDKVEAWPKLAVPLPHYIDLFWELILNVQPKRGEKMENCFGWDVDEEGWTVQSEHWPRKSEQWMGSHRDWHVAQPKCCRGGELEVLSKRLVDQLIFPSHGNEENIVHFELCTVPRKRQEARLHFAVANLMTSEAPAFAYLHLLSHLGDVVFNRIQNIGGIRLHAEPFRLLSTMAGSTSPSHQFRLLCMGFYGSRIWRMEDKWLSHHKQLIYWKWLEGTMRAREDRLGELLNKICDWRPYTEKLGFDVRADAKFPSESIDEIVQHFVSGNECLQWVVPLVVINVSKDIASWPSSCPKTMGKMMLDEGIERWVYLLTNEYSGERFYFVLSHPIGNELYINKIELQKIPE